MSTMEQLEAATAGGKRPIAPAIISLGGWSFYFLAKMVLYWRELIGLHPLENLAFAAFLLAPIGSNTAARLRAVLAWPAAVALLYYDSWLPPVDRVLSQTHLLANFSTAYLAELAGRFIDWEVIALLVAGWGAYRIVSRYLRVGVVVVLMLMTLTISTMNERPAERALNSSAIQAGVTEKAVAAGMDPDQALREFFASEAQRQVSFPSAANTVPFDIIFIHVCSLSWDDLQATGLDKHALWDGFDFLFRQFNSASSYSGPAAVRIHRAACGQSEHNALYDSGREQCYLLPSLKQSGFETNLALNHDGHFDDFLTLVRKQGVNAPLMPLEGLPVQLRSFDNSPVYDDFGALSRWLDDRQKSTSPRAALFYNTISLHDGNRIVSGPDAKLSSKDNYRPRAEKLFNDLSGFMEKIQKSGRRAVVVVIPEHGAALRGDKFQIAGLREIPMPAITTVPVGVKVIGPDLMRNSVGAQINDPSSYLALSQLISRLIETSPYGESGFAPSSYVSDLPATDFVAENEGTAVIRLNNRYWVRQDKDGWKEFPSIR